MMSIYYYREMLVGTVSLVCAEGLYSYIINLLYINLIKVWGKY